MHEETTREDLLRELEPFLALYHSSPVFRRIYRFLPHLYSLIKSRRYLAARSTVSKIGRWTAAHLLSLDNVRATRDVRMSMETFRQVVAILRSTNLFQHKNGPSQAPIELQLQVFVYYMATSGVGGSYHNIAQHFGIGEATVRKFAIRVKTALYSCLAEYVSWPSSVERKKISAAIATMSGLRGAVGMIDGTAFELKCKPQEEHEVFFNRKSRYALGGQIVCDHERRVRAALIGFPSSVHDSRQHKSMGIAIQPSEFFSDGEFLLGDSAYALQSHLMRPYKNPKAKIRENKRFNFHFSSMRMTIEHCIGMLKARFSRLRDGFFNILRDEECQDSVVRMIFACVIIHNICITADDERNDGYSDDDAIQAREDQDDDVEDSKDADDCEDGGTWTPASEFLLEIQKHLVLRHVGFT